MATKNPQTPAAVGFDPIFKSGNDCQKSGNFSNFRSKMRSFDTKLAHFVGLQPGF